MDRRRRAPTSPHHIEPVEVWGAFPAFSRPPRTSNEDYEKYLLHLQRFNDLLVGEELSLDAAQEAAARVERAWAKIAADYPEVRDSEEQRLFEREKHALFELLIWRAVVTFGSRAQRELRGAFRTPVFLPSHAAHRMTRPSEVLASLAARALAESSQFGNLRSKNSTNARRPRSSRDVRTSDADIRIAAAKFREKRPHRRDKDSSTRALAKHIAAKTDTKVNTVRQRLAKLNIK